MTRAAAAKARLQSYARRHALSLIVTAGLVGCATKQSGTPSSITVLGPGIINDPTNKSLRFDILKFGIGTFCSEMLKRGLALRLSDDHPVAGRFFGRDCGSEVNEREAMRTFTLKFSGLGYAWSNVTGRVGFEVSAALEVRPDFQIAADRSMYVYFRTRRFETSQMKIVLVESQMARGAAALTGTDPDRIAREILEAQVGRGFTVIRTDKSGQLDYSIGLMHLGQRPFHPFDVVSPDPTLANERTEVHSGQQDYLGGFNVVGNDKALSIALKVDGAPSISLAIVSAAAARQLVDDYVHKPGAAPLNEPPRFMQSVAYGSLWKQTVPLSEGTYFLLLERAPGLDTPPRLAVGDDRAAKVDTLVQVVNAP